MRTREASDQSDQRSLAPRRNQQILARLLRPSTNPAPKPAAPITQSSRLQQVLIHAIPAAEPRVFASCRATRAVEHELLSASGRIMRELKPRANS